MFWHLFLEICAKVKTFWDKTTFKGIDFCLDFYIFADFFSKVCVGLHFSGPRVYWRCSWPLAISTKPLSERPLCGFSDFFLVFLTLMIRLGCLSAQWWLSCELSVSYRNKKVWLLDGRYFKYSSSLALHTVHKLQFNRKKSLHSFEAKHVQFLCISSHIKDNFQIEGENCRKSDLLCIIYST